MSILIEQPRHPDGSRKDVYIADGRIKRIGNISPEQRTGADHTIQASDRLIAPSLSNGHSHAAMTLMRGWEDDLPLDTWLKEKIWPVEDRLSPDDIYWGTRLACVEMIKSGTTHFNDMYWEFEQICQAVSDSGIRAHVSGVFIDQFDEEMAQKQIEQSKRHAEQIDTFPDRVQFALGPHAIYTVSRESLEWASTYSREQEIPMNIHLAETRTDVENCQEQHGCSPVEYLDRLGGLHEHTVIAHGLWVSDDDIELIADRGARVVYNPIASWPRASSSRTMPIGKPVFRFVSEPTALPPTTTMTCSRRSKSRPFSRNSFWTTRVPCLPGKRLNWPQRFRPISLIFKPVVSAKAHGPTLCCWTDPIRL